MENYEMHFLMGSRPETWALSEDRGTSKVVDIASNMNGHIQVKDLIVESVINGANCYNESTTGTTSFRGEKTSIISNNNKEKKSEDHNYKGKRNKLAFQTRSHVDVLDDGYRWRKYGQKTVKNSKFPRSYYKCTFHGCNVKKQIQRLCNDEGVVVTTYEGIHSHPIDKTPQNFDHILKHIQTSYSAF